MRERGFSFAPVLTASGAQGFFGEGYRFHRYLKPFGLRFRGATFVAKTMTIESRVGNLPLDAGGYQARDMVPRCVKVYPFRGMVLNAVGLSNPGAQALFERDLWQKRREPFFLSFQAVRATLAERLDEHREFAQLFAAFLPQFLAPVGLEINFSCPNLSEPHAVVSAEEIISVLDVYAPLNIVLIPKCNVLLPIETAAVVAAHEMCDAMTISNALPWGALPSVIPWESWFGKVSPLRRRGFGDGALSGSPLFPLVVDWISRARRAGITIPIVACGGILSLQDIAIAFNAGADAIQLGTCAILRGWRMEQMIETGNMIATAFMQARGTLL